MTVLPFTRTADGIRLAVRLTPRARRDEVAGLIAGADGRPALAVRLTAPPVDGQANAVLIAFIARALGVARADVRIHSGETARLKLLDIRGDGDTLAVKIAEQAALDPR